MKRLWIAVLLLIVGASGIVAQDEEPKIELDPNIKLMALYDTPGRSWTYRNITWTRGDSPYVETEHVGVEINENGTAKVTSEISDDWGNSTRTSKMIDPSAAPDDLKKFADKYLPVQTLDMGFRKFECRRLKVEDGNTRTTTWVSTEFHPLVVKQTTFAGDDHVIKKLTTFHDGKIDPWLLYRKEGRSWKHEFAGGMSMKTSIKNVTSEGCEMETMMFMADGSSMADPTVTKIEFRTAEGVGDPDYEPPQPIEREVECKAGTYACLSYDDGNTWMLKHYLGIIVKSEGMELIAFDLGHDSHHFYRAVGNNYSLKTTTKVAGFNMTQSMKYSVSKIDGTACTYTMKSIDENGRVISTTELTHSLPETKEGEEPGPACRFTGQVEEMVHTPAGAFPAIRTESGDMVMWTWNGITIRMEMKTDDVDMVQELAELNIQ